MFHMINKRALLVEVCLSFYIFQNNFASHRGRKWVLFRLKTFLLEALYWLTAPPKCPSVIFCFQDQRRVNTSFHAKSPWLFGDN